LIMCSQKCRGGQEVVQDGGEEERESKFCKADRCRTWAVGWDKASAKGRRGFFSIRI
jgi:hypothetical protein